MPPYHAQGGTHGQALGQGGQLGRSGDPMPRLTGVRRFQVVTRAAGSSPAAATPQAARLDADYQQLLAVMGDDPVSIDLLADRSGLTAEALSSMLLILELEGCVAAMPGGVYGRLKS